ncbi:MAG: NTP transferase domain-containing protein [Phycisphaerae bacterium]
MSGRRVHALVLAAGQSRRMGRPKQSLPYGDGTMLDAVIDSVMDSTIDCLVVVANPAVARTVAASLPERCEVAVNADPCSEMIRSVQVGVRHLQTAFDPAESDGVLLLLSDQPEVGAGVITSLAEAYRLPRHPPGVLIATYGGRRGHPAVFGFEFLCQVLEWGGNRRLNELAELHPEAVREFAITTRNLPIDVNTPEDYQRLTGHLP